MNRDMILPLASPAHAFRYAWHVLFTYSLPFVRIG